MRVFLLCTHSVAGALSLGVVITSDEQMETLTVAFSQLNQFSQMIAFSEKRCQTL